jgi:hypothetical protein
MANTKDLDKIEQIYLDILINKDNTVWIKIIDK